MPGFMDVMGIAGNGIDLAACILKIRIFICQILQLCGANKGKVRRIEEEHAPLAEKILIGDFDEIVLLECHSCLNSLNFFTVMRSFWDSSLLEIFSCTGFVSNPHEAY